jgi:DNA-binding HxlR family transcriptional regulator
MGIPPLVLSELVSEISRYKRVNLGEREIEFLARIAEGDNSSYKIFSHLKKMGKPMDYKNVNKRVRRLHELGLITKAKGQSIHNAKFYAMTPEGIFYLLAGGWIVTSDKTWIRNYKDNIFLKYLLEPYFQEDTIEIYGIHFDIGKYLYECCQMILSFSDFIHTISKYQSKISKEGLERLKESLLKQLQTDLEWQAKSLAFKLVSKRTDLWYTFSSIGTRLKDERFVELFHQKNIDLAPSFAAPIKQHGYLAQDKKFMKLSRNLGNEYEKAYSGLVEHSQIND